MIEPQNTVFPVAAEPRSAPQPEDEVLGFGAMLAQSLGVVTPLDSAAVQQIASGSQQQSSSAEGELSQDGTSTRGDSPESIVAAPSIGGPSAVSAPITDLSSPLQPAEPTPVSGGISDPVPTEEIDRPPSGVVTDPNFSRGPSVPLAPDVRPVPHETGVPKPTDPGDGIWDPVLTDSPTTAPSTSDLVGREAMLPAAPNPIDSIGLPVPSGTDTGSHGGESVPVTVQPTTTDPRPDAQIDRVVGPRLQPAPAIPIGSDTPPLPVAQDQAPQPDLPDPSRAPSAPGEGVEPVADRAIPTSPTPVGATELTDVAIAGSSQDSGAVAKPTPTLQSRVDLDPRTPVRLDTSDRVATTANIDTAAGIDRPVAVDSGVGNAPLHFNAPTNAPTTVATAASPSDVAPTQTSALAERVMHAVDLQRTQPPPRSMVVEIPEIEGLRLIVSVRSGGHVSVMPAASGGNAEAFSPFAEDLSRVLTERGFVMNGDDRRGHRNPHETEEPAPFRNRRSTFRRPIRTDNDLRI